MRVWYRSRWSSNNLQRFEFVIVLLLFLSFLKIGLKTLDRMQIAKDFGGARSLWRARFFFFVNFFFVKNQLFHIFFEGTLDRTMRPKCNFCLWVINHVFYCQNFCNFRDVFCITGAVSRVDGGTVVVNCSLLIIFVLVFFWLPSLLLLNGFGCMCYFLSFVFFFRIKLWLFQFWESLAICMSHHKWEMGLEFVIDSDAIFIDWWFMLFLQTF